MNAPNVVCIMIHSMVPFLILFWGYTIWKKAKSEFLDWWSNKRKVYGLLYPALAAGVVIYNFFIHGRTVVRTILGTNVPGYSIEHGLFMLVMCYGFAAIALAILQKEFSKWRRQKKTRISRREKERLLSSSFSYSYLLPGARRDS